MENVKGENKMSDTNLSVIPESLPTAAADVVNNLITKLSNAVGWIATPKGKKADMKIAVDTYINELEDAKINPLAKAALISNARKSIKEYINQNDIIQMAMEQLGESANPEGVDDDWLAYFMDGAKNISSDHVKILWAKLLAGECENNGSVPKRLMQILLVMSEVDVRAFNTLCSFNVKYTKYHENIFLNYRGEKSELTAKYGINYMSVLNLELLGLIKYSPDGFVIFLNKSDDGDFLKIQHGNSIIRFCINNMDQIPIGNFTWSPVGNVLKELIVSEPAVDYAKYIKDFYFSKCFKDVEVIE